MDYEAKLKQNFCCLKCRSHSAVAKTLSLPRGLPYLLTGNVDKYVFLTCTLCGFTEVYDPHVFAGNHETQVIEAPAEIPQGL